MESDADRIAACGPEGAVPAVLAVLVAAALLLPAGCTSPPPPAAASVRPLTSEEEGQRFLLTDSERTDALRAMQGVLGAHRPVDPPAPAPDGVRFRDAPAAAGDACDDVEAAVCEVQGDPAVDRRLIFRLRTIEDWPGELVVTRVDGPEVYRAEAWFGRFPDSPAAVARRDALLAAFDVWMRKYGKKRGWD